MEVATHEANVHTIWLHRWITVWDIWRGEFSSLASFEYRATQLWVWEWDNDAV